ncbi:GNAT family N-acetyltransferase [Phenylobacterium terrae]|uniref:GNAT family N-acetyltransferase n=1 Tax=Phenylobacterium terrae TaxID=2665495 RepID=A0ABW4MZN9_9CAUL
MDCSIVDISTLTEAQRAEAARILREALPWTDFAEPGAAEAEVALTVADEDRSGLAALDGERVLGWIGVIETYSHAWELHPLAVDPPHQRRGIGGRLVAALEERVRAAGVITLYLGTDDETDGTNLYGRELFPDVLKAAAELAPTNGHAFTFYRRHGYEVVGVMPHANGFGRPDIFMAKRIG